MPLVTFVCMSCHPQVRAFLKPPMLGVVLQTYGSGNAPNNRDDLISEIKRATRHGVLIINCTQCLHGPVVDQYATGKVRVLRANVYWFTMHGFLIFIDRKIEFENSLVFFCLFTCKNLNLPS